MRRSRRPPRRSGCPIGIALDMLGDPWTLLVVRDLMFKGGRTFGDFESAGEGIASNVLADRLARLASCGLIEKRRDDADARRWAYRLTRKGIDLAPVLVEIVLWAARHETTDAPRAVLAAMRRDKEAFVAAVRDEWQASLPAREARGPKRTIRVRSRSPGHAG